jgi:hypothetical protein
MNPTTNPLSGEDSAHTPAIENFAWSDRRADQQA